MIEEMLLASCSVQFWRVRIKPGANGGLFRACINFAIKHCHRTGKHLCQDTPGTWQLLLSQGKSRDNNIQRCDSAENKSAQCL